jgi:hypothetical protein
MKLAPLFLAAVLLAPSAHALDVERLDVRRNAARYVVEFRAYLAAPADQVGAVLKDYENYPKLDARILESRREAGDRSQLHTRLRGCVGGLFCRTMQRVETLEEMPGGLIATAVPGKSDVTFGHTHSQWQPRNGGTELVYRLEIEPDFWVPPLFGPPLMIRTLREGTLSLFTNVERVANQRAQAVKESTD